MKMISQSCLALALVLGSLSLQAAPLSSATSPELIALLRANYVDYGKVADQADLPGMIARSQGGLSVAPAAAADQRMFGTMLPDHVIYWRAGSFTPATSWAEMTAAANGADAAGLVLDLRSNSTPDDFAGALRVAQFLAKGQPGLVFHEATGTLPTTGGAVLNGKPTLIVLTDKQTRGAAEILAVALQVRGALVMGEATAGRAAIFHEVPLASGTVLRYAAAHVYLANGADLWGRPVVPDVTLTLSSRAEAAALSLIDRQQVSAVIDEQALRHRMSEAALVTGQDPEQDSFIASHEAAPAPAPATHDWALLQALDSLKAIRALQGQVSSLPARVAATSSASPGTMLAATSLGK